MRGLLGFVAAAIALLVALVLGLGFLATDRQPDLSRPAPLTMADLEQGRAVIEGLGLGAIRDGESRRLVLKAADLDRGLAYLAARLAKGSASAEIVAEQLRVRASLPLLGRYLNLELTLVPAGDLLAPAHLRLGALPLPAALTGELMLRALALSPQARELAAARKLLDSARLQGQALELAFTWRGDAVARALAGAQASGTEQTVLAAYRAHLAQVKTRDFAVLLGAAFALAQTRGGDPVAENRAALTVLAESALGSRLLSRGSVAGQARNSGLRLAGRADFSQHFALSAFLAATGGTAVSDLAGVYKEVQDSQGGSGFSFTDLAADRAGSRFGELATRSPDAARRLQQRLAGSRKADDYFPAARDLPEFMPAAEFQRRFGGVGAPAYRAMMDEIERRIGALPLYDL